MFGFFNRDIMFITHHLLPPKKGTCLRWQDRQAVSNRLGERQVSGKGAERDCAEGEVIQRGNV